MYGFKIKKNVMISAMYLFATSKYILLAHQELKSGKIQLRRASRSGSKLFYCTAIRASSVNSRKQEIQEKKRATS